MIRPIVAVALASAASLFAQQAGEIRGRIVDPAQAVVIPIPPGSSLLTLETGPDQGTMGIAGFAKAGFVK